MKQLKIIFIFFSLVLLSCNTTSTVSESQKNQLIQQKKNQKSGIVLYKSRADESKNRQSKKEFYFRMNEKEYFVKIPEGYVSEEELLKNIDKQINVKGEIKNGKWEFDTPGSILNQTETIKGRSGEYFVIYKILNK